MNELEEVMGKRGFIKALDATPTESKVWMREPTSPWEKGLDFSVQRKSTVTKLFPQSKVKVWRCCGF